MIKSAFFSLAYAKDSQRMLFRTFRPNGKDKGQIFEREKLKSTPPHAIFIPSKFQEEFSLLKEEIPPHPRQKHDL